VSIPEFANHCGLLPLAVPVAAAVAVRLGDLAVPAGSPLERMLSGIVIALALFVVGARVLAVVHLLSAPGVAGALGLSALVVFFVRPGTKVGFSLRSMWSWDSLPMVTVAAVALGMAAVVAYFLPVWQWDALGYHLPFVNFALSAHGLEGVPRDVPYLSTYPHDVELLMIGFRALLPDDTLVDAAQIPFGLAGALATAAIARLHGAAPPHAAAAGSAWLVVPAVFLQLPTNYVDVASAAFLLGAGYYLLSPPSPRRLLLAGVATGLYLGTKPSAPVGTMILFAWNVGRGIRARWLLPTVLAAVLVPLLGAESYVRNFLEHGNPVWPVRIDSGWLHLPGQLPMRDLLQSGAGAPHVTGSLANRVLRSWTSLTSLPAFDMRIGGLGPLFLLSLPVAAGSMIRDRRGGSLLLLAVSLASPDPAVARYVLAFPALSFAMAAPAWTRAAVRWSPWVGAAAAGIGLFQVAYAWPGLTGEGPPLQAYARMSPEQRRAAVGADGSPSEWIHLRERVGPRESFAYDESFELPYLAWDSAMTHGVTWIPPGLTVEAAGDLLERSRARVIVAGEGTPALAWVASHPERFVSLFRCKSTPCRVYARR